MSVLLEQKKKKKNRDNNWLFRVCMSRSGMTKYLRIGPAIRRVWVQVTLRFFSVAVFHLLSLLKFFPSFALIVLFTLHLCSIPSTLLLLHSVWRTNIIYSTSKNFDFVFF